MTTERKLQEDLKESVHRVWLAGLGAVAMAEQEGSKFLKNLVEKGEEYEAKGKERFSDVKEKVEEARGKARERAESTWEKVGDRFDETVAAALRRLGVPGREEIATLTRRVEELTAVVEQLRDNKLAAKKAAAKKTDEAAPN
ncbi:MAG TPA: phasin family protein [Thermoanaerobaculia bacterium]|jgi:poly(hydroxyalkanoate) granule-associated protein